LQLVFFIILKSRQLATAVRLRPVQSSPVSSLFVVLWTGLLNSTAGNNGLLPTTLGGINDHHPGVIVGQHLSPDQGVQRDSQVLKAAHPGTEKKTTSCCKAHTCCHHETKYSSHRISCFTMGIKGSSPPEFVKIDHKLYNIHIVTKEGASYYESYHN